MAVDAIFCAKEFYTLESLHYVVSQRTEFGRKSAEKLLADIEEFKEIYTEKLANMLFDYSAMVVFGEMRHSKDKCSWSNVDIPVGGSRSDSYEVAKEYNPYDILRAGEKLFAQKWSPSYGGEAWKKISKAVLLRDKINNQVFCDMCFSLSHNNSIYLDKDTTNMFKLGNSTKYKHVLDLKFTENDPEIVINHCVDQTGWYLTQLVRRAILLGLLHNVDLLLLRKYREEKTYSPSYEYLTYIRPDVAELTILNYKPINWGNYPVRPDLIESYKKQYSDYYDDNDEEDDNYEEELYEQENEEEEIEKEGYFYATNYKIRIPRYKVSKVR